MLAKYLIVNDDGLDVPIIFSEVTEHWELSKLISANLKTISAGKLMYFEDQLSVTHGSISLDIVFSPVRQNQDKEILTRFFEKEY